MVRHKSCVVGPSGLFANPKVREVLERIRDDIVARGMKDSESTAELLVVGCRPRRLKQNQRRLNLPDQEVVGQAYREGRSIDSLAREYGINRTTVISHLDKRGVKRRGNARKLTDTQVQEAAEMRAQSQTLIAVATKFGVSVRTMGRELRRLI